VTETRFSLLEGQQSHTFLSIPTGNNRDDGASVFEKGSERLKWKKESAQYVEFK
jgi:hypothetical protein